MTASTTSPVSPDPKSDAPKDAPQTPVRQAKTSAGTALLWIGLVVVSFAITLAVLFWAAVQIP